MEHDEYVNQIRTRFSDLFDPSNSNQDWQFLITIGPGWWPLFTDYCEQLEGVLKHHGEIGKWYIRQTKEKMGELRIYVISATPERPDSGSVMEWIDGIGIDPLEPSTTLEMISAIREQIVGRANRTCEECGEPGGLRSIDGWYRTCCELHFDQWREQRASK